MVARAGSLEFAVYFCGSLVPWIIGFGGPESGVFYIRPAPYTGSEMVSHSADPPSHTCSQHRAQATGKVARSDIYSRSP